jgi:hypothetical protein
VKALLLQLLLPPLVFIAPWLPCAAKGEWLSFSVVLMIWALGWCTTLLLWAGPGFILLVTLGIMSVARARFSI